MSGILCSFSSKQTNKYRFTEIISSSLVGRQYIVDSRCSNGFNIGLVSTPGSSASVEICKENNLLIYVDGYFVDAFKTKKTSAHWFLEKYLEKGQNCISELNGSFNILINDLDSDEVLIATDRYGTRPLFYVPDDEGLSVAYRAELLVQQGLVKKKLNQNMIANMLSHSRIWANDQTFYKGINLLPARSIIKWSIDKGVSISEYSITSLFKDTKPSIKGLAKILKEVVSDFEELPNVGLSLSGGLDSRLLLAAGFKGHTFSWGYRKDNDEIKLAEDCAIATNNPWNFIHLTPDSFLDLDGEGDNVREGLDLFVQSYSLKAYKQVAEADIAGLMTGLALDFTMGGSYSPKDFNDIKFDQALKFIFSKTEYFSEELRGELICSGDILESIDEIETEIKNKLKVKANQIGVQEAIQDLFFETRIKRWIFHRQMWQRAYFEDYIPTFDNRVIDYLDLFTEKERANNKLSREVLLELSEPLSAIPYQRTNLPPSSPIEFWRKGAKLEEQKEKLARTIFYRTQSKVFIPYNRYYSNFDEWLRVNSNWKKVAHELLLSDDTQVTIFVNKDKIEQMLIDQGSGKEANFSRIIILMSLEKTLRTF